MLHLRSIQWACVRDSAGIPAAAVALAVGATTCFSSRAPAVAFSGALLAAVLLQSQLVNVVAYHFDQHSSKVTFTSSVHRILYVNALSDIVLVKVGNLHTHHLTSLWQDHIQ